MSADDRWLAAVWPSVRSNLPPSPGAVVELGCGSLGGFVPRLREAGYTATGIDPAAPAGDDYRPIEFEQSDVDQLDALIACTSLHHVADPGTVLDKVAQALLPGGRVVVIEWDWEGFDEATARWCFDRLARSGGDGWLRRRRDEWAASGSGWEEFVREWARGHGMHGAGRIIDELDQRFERIACTRGPFVFSELPDTSEATEIEAIDAGEIRALRIDYVGRRNSHA